MTDGKRATLKTARGRWRNRIDMVSYDALWQMPAKTERHAFDMVPGQLPYTRGHAYLAFPWAALFDAVNTGDDALARTLTDILLKARERLSAYDRVLTVCQHIHYADYASLFELAGVTDAFCSHKIRSLQEACGVRLHSFPLYPVQFDAAAPVYRDGRRHLFSFMGARANDWYRTGVREHIASQLASHEDGFVQIKDQWHYHEAVFENGSISDSLDDEAYKETMLDSVFCLCPSGTGANTIRLWEAIGAGCIPVILSEEWDPPGGLALWEPGAVFAGETAEAVAALPDRLKALQADPVQIERMRAQCRLIWELYGPARFVTGLLLEAGER